MSGASEISPTASDVRGAPALVQAAPDMTSCEQVRQMFIRCRRLIRQDDRAGAAGGAGGGAGGGRRGMVIDLRSVTQADTKLMACLVGVYQLARTSSVPVELRASRAVAEMMDFCRLSWLLEWTRPRAEQATR